MGPWNAVWLTWSSQPKATSTTSGGHGAFLATNNPSARNRAAKKAAYEPVWLMNEPTPPTQGSTQVVLMTLITPSSW